LSSFYDFVDARGVNLIKLWLDGLPLKVSAKINTRLLFMMSLPVWPEQYVSSLVGWPGLVELRIGSFGTQYRPLGFYGPGRREFTILFGAIEKGKLPKRVLEIVDENRRIVLRDASRIAPHEFD
jgi:hypothetical protein